MIEIVWEKVRVVLQDEDCCVVLHEVIVQGVDQQFCLPKLARKGYSMSCEVF